MVPDRIAISLRPEDLVLVSDRQLDVELKFDWEHTAILQGHRDLGAVLDEQGIAPSRVRSVHLPPGIESRGDDVRMSVTPANRGAILDFVHGQLDVVADASLVAHPPKSFNYATQFDLIASITASTGRPLSIENPPDPSDWYTPEAMAFFARWASEHPRLGDLWLTVDSGHLPHQGATRRETLAIDEAATSDVVRKAREELGVVDNPFDEIADRLARDIQELLANSPVGVAIQSGEDNDDDLADPGYLPLLKTLLLCGDRVRSVHLNEPWTDGVPRLDSHATYPVLATCLALYDGGVVLEPGDLVKDPDALFDRIDRLIAWDRPATIRIG